MALTITVRQTLDLGIFAEVQDADDYRELLVRRYGQALSRYMPDAELCIDIDFAEASPPTLSVSADADEDLEAQLDRTLYQITQYARDLVTYTQHSTNEQCRQH